MQSLSNPLYLQYLADQKYFEDEEFVAYLHYLQYFQEDKYLKYLQYEVRTSLTVAAALMVPPRYPGPTLRALELLQQEQFRKDILSPALVDAMVREGFEAATSGLNR